MEILSVLPDLAISVVAVVALAYVTKEFILHLKTIHSEHKEQLHELHVTNLAELKEREIAMRSVEREVRSNIMSQLGKNTEIMTDTSKVMERVIGVLNK